MLFVNGERDPWSAEPFSVGKGAKDSYVLEAPGANHGANIAGLNADDKAKATSVLLKWAGVKQGDGAQPKRLTKYDAELDRPDKRDRMLRP
jgi:hypothetical protein